MKRRRGQGLVEFALILPVLLFILLGIIEAAFVIQGYLTVQHAAREAARFAVTYQPIQGACLNDVPAAYPFCPRDDSESDEEYHARRVELIKGEARRAAAGLRINDEYLGNTRDRFEANWQEPGFFGIAVWGYPSFEIDCNAYDPWAEDNPCFDHPGLEGLPVRVLVEHNVELVDPLYRPIAEAIIDGPYVPVRADTQMLNEGIQVDFSDRVPPDFEKNPGFGEPPLPTVTDPNLTTATPTNTPTQTVTPTPTLTSTTYLVWLSGDATNELPDDRSHEFIATVTDAQGQPVQGVQLRVSFSTDEGGFSYSGGGPKYDEQLTDGLGQASVTLFGNGPGMATIRAWLDYDGDDSWDDREPSDTATKTWDVSGPYITASDHEVIPQQYIAVDVMDHDPAGNPYRLLWCVVSGADITRTVTNELYVDGGGDAAGLGFGIPAGSQGLYRLETHSGSGDCGSTGLVAHSADIRVLAPPSNSVSISGEVRVLVSGIPVTFQGVDVWAYGLGEVYHTVTAPDGTYEFYSIPRGIYTIYAETWIGSWLRFASTTEAVYNDRDDVNLLLL